MALRWSRGCACLGALVSNGAGPSDHVQDTSALRCGPKLLETWIARTGVHPCPWNGASAGLCTAANAANREIAHGP